MTNPASRTDAFAQWARSYWHGEQPLWAAFWLYGMIFGTVLGTVNTVVSAFLINHMFVAWASGHQVTMLFFTWPVLTILGFWWTYYVWHVVSVWRCGRKSTRRNRWAARIFVLCVTLTYWPVFVLFHLGYQQ